MDRSCIFTGNVFVIIFIVTGTTDLKYEYAVVELFSADCLAVFINILQVGNRWAADATLYCTDILLCCTCDNELEREFAPLIFLLSIYHSLKCKKAIVTVKLPERYGA